MSKEFYDKYGKIVDCFSCNCIEPCSKSDSPLCSEGYVFFAKDKIADLEAKLAESEENNKLLEMQLQDMERSKLSWENQYFTLYNTLKNYREVTEKQLAEKEKEIEDLNYRLDLKFVNYTNSESFKFLEDQDKISFAVAELNKLWDCLYKTDDKGYVIRFASMNDRDKFNEVFNNQIKQLKEMK